MTIRTSPLAPVTLVIDRLSILLLATTNLAAVGRAQFGMLCQLEYVLSIHEIRNAKGDLLFFLGNAIDGRVELLKEMRGLEVMFGVRGISEAFLRRDAEERGLLDDLLKLIGAFDKRECLALLMRVEQFRAARDPDIHRRLDAIYAEMQAI